MVLFKQVKKKWNVQIRRFFKDILEEIWYDHKYNLYFIEEGKEIASKRGVSFIPPIASKIEIEDGKSLFVIEEIYIQDRCGVIYLSGKKYPA